MQIVEVESFVLKLENDEAYLGALPDGTAVPDGYEVRPPWRSLYSRRFETLLVKVTADNGVAGWGEALAPVAPEVPAAVVDLLLAPQLVGGSALTPRPCWTTMRELMRERGHLVGHQADAMAAVDIALWDLAARLRGVSMAEALGGAFCRTVPTYVSGLPRPDDPGRAELAAQWAGQGATAVKLHLGHGVEADLATVDAVRDAAPGLAVAVDAHWAYRPAEARRLVDGLAARDAWFLEAPLAPEDVAGHRRLGSQSTVPIAVGETLRNRYEFADWMHRGALEIAQPDVARTGVTEAMAVAELAAAAHLPTAPHHSVGLGVALAAGLQLSAAIEDLLVFEYQPTSTGVAQRILRTPLEPHPNSFDLPDGPGLGIDVDEQVVRDLSGKD